MSKNKEYPVLEQEQPKKSHKDQRTESNRGQRSTQVKGKNDYEKIIKIQEKIITIQRENIESEKLINSQLWEKYFNAWENLKGWERAYKTLMDKWLAAGIYTRDRRTYMRDYMRKKRGNGLYKKITTMKGKNEKKNTRGTKSE